MENKQDKGFTLVELLIVIVILGILATVTVFAVRGITQRSQENACDVEFRALETAVEAYYVDNDQDFPPSLAALASGGFVKTAPDTAVWDYTGGGATPGVVSAVSGGTCDNPNP
jgi:general secretion pathway protein G